MKNYTIKSTNSTITIQFKEVKVVVHNITSEIKKQLDEYANRFNNFKDIYRAIVTNPNMTVQTVK